MGIGLRPMGEPTAQAFPILLILLILSKFSLVAVMLHRVFRGYLLPQSISIRTIYG